MLKIPQARLQQYMNRELPDVQAGFSKAEEPEIKLLTSAGSSKKQESLLFHRVAKSQTRLNDWTNSLFRRLFKRLFSSSSLSAIRVVSSAYLRLLIFHLAILIPACASSSPAFLMMYSAYKLNMQGDNIQLWRMP